MQNYILLPIIQYRHTPHWFPYALGTWLLMIVQLILQKNREPEADDEDWWWWCQLIQIMTIDADDDDWWLPVCAKVEGGCGGFSVILLQELESLQQLPVININCYHYSLVMVKDDYRSSWSDALIIFIDHSITGQTRADLRPQPQLQQPFTTMRYSQPGWLNCGVSLLSIVFFFMAHSCSFWLTPSLWLWLFLAYCGSQGSCSARYAAAA